MNVCLQGVTQASGFDHCWLLNECTLVLRTQSKASKPDQGYMAGALAGLSSALALCQVPGIYLVFSSHLPGIYTLSYTANCMSHPRAACYFDVIHNVPAFSSVCWALLGSALAQVL